MIILNTTFYVHESIDRLFHQWLQQEYLPSAMKAGLGEPSVARLLMEPLCRTVCIGVGRVCSDMA